MQLFKNYLWLCCLATHLVVADCTIDLEVTLHSYRNPTSSDCSGSSCDTIFSPCDNEFTFCLRSSSASSCTFGSVRSEEISDDDFTFSPSILTELGLSNPIIFRRIAPTGGIVLQIQIFDADNFNSDDHVDTININILIPTNMNIGSSFSSRQSYTGICRRATLQLSYRVTCSRSNFAFPDCTECLPNYYGINCDISCIPRNDASGHYTCNADGSRTCIPHYAGLPNCLTCEPNYFGDSCSVFCIPPTSSLICNSSGQLECTQSPGLAPLDCTECRPDYYGVNCGKFCTPRNDTSGHYTCNSTDGSRICLPRYVGLPDCLSCETNYFGDSCSVLCIPPTTRHNCTTSGELVCVRGFAPPNCTECLSDYYGINCDTFCIPHNNASGHYTCNQTDGSRMCIPHYAGLPDCLSCEMNYFGDSCSVLCIPPTARHRCTNSGQIVCRMSRFALPDCTSCLPNFQGPNCNDCAPNYFPPGDCNVHCISQNNNNGHFTCDPQTGAIHCLSGFTDPQTNCTTEVPTPSLFTTPGAIGAYVGAGLGAVLLCCCAWWCFCTCLKWDPGEDQVKFTCSNWRQCCHACQKQCCCCTCEDCKDCIGACIRCPAACVKGLTECARGCCQACVECPAACAKACCKVCIECPGECIKGCCKACIECPGECIKGCFKPY